MFYDLSLSLVKLLYNKGMKYFKSEKCWCPLQKVVADVAGHSETLSTSTEKIPQKDSKSIILQNTRIATGKTNAVDISFVPKSVGLTVISCRLPQYNT